MGIAVSRFMATGVSVSCKEVVRDVVVEAVVWMVLVLEDVVWIVLVLEDVEVTVVSVV